MVLYSTGPLVIQGTYYFYDNKIIEERFICRFTNEKMFIIGFVISIKTVLRQPHIWVIIRLQLDI